jgi:hypothetical protein
MKLTLLREPDASAPASQLEDAAPIGAPQRRFFTSEPYFRGLDRFSP